LNDEFWIVNFGLENGEADGGWRMADGGWRMADGGWWMVDFGCWGILKQMVDVGL